MRPDSTLLCDKTNCEVIIVNFRKTKNQANLKLNLEVRATCGKYHSMTLQLSLVRHHCDISQQTVQAHRVQMT